MSATNSSLRVRWRAPAKINPFLAVLGRRADGYHELVTTLLALDWCDELELWRAGAEPARLELCGPAASPEIPSDARNLALRAALVACGDDGAGLQLKLYKSVPAQAGLGGGSSDAAAALVAADELLARRLSAAERASALASLGSDCPFFALAPSGHALCSGRGERVEPLPAVAPGWIIPVLVPTVGSPTAAVYAALATSLRSSPQAPSVPRELFDLDLHSARERLRNDLEPAALRAVPALARVRAVLDEHGAAHWRLCGSGSAFYGIYRDPARAAAELDELRAAIDARAGGVRCARLCRPLGRGAHAV